MFLCKWEIRWEVTWLVLRESLCVCVVYSSPAPPISLLLGPAESLCVLGEPSQCLAALHVWPSLCSQVTPTSPRPV